MLSFWVPVFGAQCCSGRSAGAAPLAWEGLLRLERVLAAAGAAPLWAEGRLLRAVGRRSSPAGSPVLEARLPSRRKAASKGKQGGQTKGGLQGCEKEERVSRPALLPESR